MESLKIDLSHRSSMRVRKTTQPNANQIKVEVKSNTSSKSSPSIPLIPLPRPNLLSKRKPFPSNNPKSLSEKKRVLNPMKTKLPI